MPPGVIETASVLKCRLDLRWIEHGYGHYLTQAACGGETDWRDMVKFHMMQTLTYFDHAQQGVAVAGDGEDRKKLCQNLPFGLIPRVGT